MGVEDICNGIHHIYIKITDYYSSKAKNKNNFSFHTMYRTTLTTWLHFDFLVLITFRFSCITG